MWLPQWLCSEESACTAGSISQSGRPPGGGMVAHSSILAWRFPWTEEPGGLESKGLHRVRPSGAHMLYIHTHTHSNPQFYLPLRVFACWDEKAISSAVLMGFGGLLASPLSSVSWFPCALLISEQKEPVYYLH